MDWASGYTAEIGYVYGYYPTLNPLRIKLAFLNQGIAFPEVKYGCELGFGQGLSINFHAAASVTQWYGNDFNPSQVSFAQELADSFTSKAYLCDQSFAEFCQREDLPAFDYIGLHGIWSWISEENQRYILAFIQKKLKVGGVVYISYNTLPGWAPFLPVRELLLESMNKLSCGGAPVIEKIDTALSFVQRLFDTNPRFLEANPHLAKRFANMQTQNRQYLAHEYFNKDWHPLTFSKIANDLANIKLDFACSANYVEHLDSLNFTQEQIALLEQIKDPVHNQVIRDLCMNQQFRRDYWVKGKRTITPLEQAEQLGTIRLLLIRFPKDVELTVSCGLGSAKMNPNVYRTILEKLSNGKPHTLKELAISLPHIGTIQLREAALILVEKGDCILVQEDIIIEKVKKSVQKINLFLMDKARFSAEVNYLVSPLSGGGIPVSRFGQLFLLAHTKGIKLLKEKVNFIWQILNSQNQKVLKDGKELETIEENIQELTERAVQFENGTFPHMRALGII